MDRLTKTLVILSTLAAAYVEARLAARGFHPLFYLSLAAFALAAVLGAWWRGAIARVVLSFAYITPALFMLWIERNHFTFQAVWLAAILGLIVSGRGAWRWSVPRPWKWPIVGWALVVAVSWPIVALRELDFTLVVLDTPHLANMSSGILPAEAVIWTASVVLVHQVALLWIDWLFRHFDRSKLPEFRREVLYPLGASALIACAVGAYQGFIDIGFLSGHVWPSMRRAPGTMMDANVFGTIAALWSAGYVALAFMPLTAARATAAVGGFLLAFIGVWVSGSRTALLATIVGTVAVLWQVSKATRSERATETGRRWAPGARRLVLVWAFCLACVLILVLLALRSMTAIERARGLLPGLGSASLASTLRALWVRDGYGTAAVAMIREHPWSGAGLGAYHTMVYDYALHAAGFGIPPDNAQNWFRHHLAELGLVGSLPWIAWCALLVWALVRRPSDSTWARSAGVLKGPIVGFGLASLLGVPGQDAVTAVTFLTFVFWYLMLAAPGRPEGLRYSWQRPASVAQGFSPAKRGPGRPALRHAQGTPSTSRPEGLRYSLLILAIVAVHATLTFAAARSELSVPQRAVRFGWNYQYGFYDPERGPGGLRYRWTAREAVTIVPVQGRVLKLECWIDHPDAAREPVHVRVWVNTELVIDAHLRDDSHLTRDVSVPSGAVRVAVRTWVSRTWRPSRYGSTDTRELGLAIADWQPLNGEGLRP